MYAQFTIIIIVWKYFKVISVQMHCSTLISRFISRLILNTLWWGWILVMQVQKLIDNIREYFCVCMFGSKVLVHLLQTVKSQVSTHIQKFWYWMCQKAVEFRNQIVNLRNNLTCAYEKLRSL